MYITIIYHARDHPKKKVKFTFQDFKTTNYPAQGHHELIQICLILHIYQCSRSILCMTILTKKQNLFSNFKTGPIACLFLLCLQFAISEKFSIVRNNIMCTSCLRGIQRSSGELLIFSSYALGHPRFKQKYLEPLHEVTSF